MLRLTGKLDEVLALAVRGVKVSSKRHGPDDPQTALALQNQAEVLFAQKRRRTRTRKPRNSPYSVGRAAKPLNSPLPSLTFTSVTIAARGPRRAHSIIAATASGVPCTMASTVPS